MTKNKYISDTPKKHSLDSVKVKETGIKLSLEEINPVRIFNIDSVMKIINLFEQHPQKFNRERLYGNLKQIILDILDQSNSSSYIKATR